jgi:hypothetical protein
MEAIFAFFALPIVFYALVAFFILGIALNIDDDKTSGWGWTTIFSAGLVWLVGNHYNVDFGAILTNPTGIAIAAGSYLVVGILWSFAKWYFKLSNVREAYLELKQQYIAKNKPVNFLTVPKSKDEVKSKEDAVERDTLIEANGDFFRLVKSHMRNYDHFHDSELQASPNKIVKVIQPLSMQHKSSITQWIMFWPVSFVWTIINDPVRKIANYIFSRIKGTFQKMSDSMFAEV